jgi:2-C-methyl-D-erythritol 2,4-cyclodiphosphate synthase
LRAGIGFDVHAFDADRRLVIGGVTIPDHDGLAGHSDADVLCHAVGDALLGAAGLGDLGAMFPDSDRWKDASSLAILEEVGSALHEAGWSVVNVDATVITESPRLGPHIPEMRAKLSAVLKLSPQLVSVKATTTDRLGFTGRGEGIASMAVALVQPLG